MGCDNRIMCNVVEIKDKKWYAIINPEHGADIEKLTFCKKDVYFPLKDESMIAENPFVHGIPILLPANRTSGGCFEFDGKTYSLPINDKKSESNLHGLVYAQRFTVIDRQDSRICLEYRNFGNVYPFEFLLRIEYCICGDSFLQKYSITNTGHISMPYTFGLHTTFCEPKSFAAPIDAVYERDEKFLPTGRILALDKDKECYRSGAKSYGNEITGYYRAAGTKSYIDDFEYEFSENFDTVTLYNGAGKSGFLCLEPQSGLVNGLNIPGGFRILETGMTEVFYTRLSHM